MYLASLNRTLAEEQTSNQNIFNMSIIDIQNHLKLPLVILKYFNQNMFIAVNHSCRNVLLQFFSGMRNVSAKFPSEPPSPPPPAHKKKLHGLRSGYYANPD
jgi:hypothetical protein